MVRAGFGVRMKMPPPLFPPSGPNSRFSSNVANFPTGRKPSRDFFSEPPSTLPFVRRPPPPPPLMSQQPLLPPLKRRFFPPRETAGEFSVPPMRPRIAPGMGFGLKRSNVRGSFLGAKLAKGDNLNVGIKGLKFPRFSQAQKPANQSGKNETKSGTKNKKKSKKKSKKKTYTLTKEFPYYCETCDRGFISMDKFSEHRSQHVTCGKQGCTFTGHPKIVEKHFMMQHRTGLFNRIVKGNSPEEIQKWITERKKHFPTKEKIDQKRAQREEMEKRGERYAERRKSLNQRNSNFKAGPHNRFNNNLGNKHPPFKSHAFARRGIFTRNKNSGERVEGQPRKRDPILTEDEDFVVRNLPPFRGTAYCLNLENIALNDDDISIMSDDSDNYSNFTNDCDETIVSEGIDIEMKNLVSPIVHFSGDTDTEDPLDKYFKISEPLCEDALAECSKSCDNPNENIEVETVESSGFPRENDVVEYSKSNDSPKKNSGEKYSNSCDSIGENISANNPSNTINSSTTPNITVLSDQNIVKCASSLNHSLALLQCYDSDGNSDQDEGTTNLDGNSRNDNVTVVSASDDLQKNGTDDDSAPEEYSSKDVENVEQEKQENSDKDETKNQNEKPKRKRKRRKDGKSEDDGEASAEKQIPEERMPQVFQTRRRYRPPTLLEKLLTPEIKHERNLILQCIRYVVENDYFNIGQSK